MRLLNELVNMRTIPCQLLEAVGQRLVHLVNSAYEEWLLDWQQREDLVVHVDDGLESTLLDSVDVSLLLKLAGLLWHVFIQDMLQVPFFEEALKSWVQVQSYEPLFGCCLSDEESLAQVTLGEWCLGLLHSVDLGLGVLVVGCQRAIAVVLLLHCVCFQL